MQVDWLNRNFVENLLPAMSGRRTPPASTSSSSPLIVAIHGGTYTSAYFDVPGFSLLDHAASLDIEVWAPDRPGYGSTAPLPFAEMGLEGQARFIGKAMQQAWLENAPRASGVVLIGHSIGGAIATYIAAQAHDFPLLGLAISGVGLRTTNAAGTAPTADTPPMAPPASIKDTVMFGPDGSYRSPMPMMAHPANASCPAREGYEINSIWSSSFTTLAAAISVPVHYRQAEHDKLWHVNQREIAAFGDAFANAPFVDARIIAGTGHCIDFHSAGAALQVQQIGFALECSNRAP